MPSFSDAMQILEKFDDNKNSLTVEDRTNLSQFLLDLTQHPKIINKAQKKFNQLESLRKAGLLELVWLYGKDDHTLSKCYVKAVTHFMALKSRDIIKAKQMSEYVNYYPKKEKGNLLTRLDIHSCVRLLTVMLKRYCKLADNLKEAHPEFTTNQINNAIKNLHPEFIIHNINYAIQSSDKHERTLASRVAMGDEKINAAFIKIVEAIYPIHCHHDQVQKLAELSLYKVQENLICIFAATGEHSYFELLAKRASDAALMSILHRLFNSELMDFLSKTPLWHLDTRCVAPFVKLKHPYTDYILTLFTEENKDEFQIFYEKIFLSEKTFLNKLFYAKRDWYSLYSPTANAGALGKIQSHYEQLFPLSKRLVA